MEQRGTPTPHLQIVPADSLLPHEEHDFQRSVPLIERLRNEAFIINPPIVAPVDEHNYVILDGANRCHAFRALGYPHMLVQVVHYNAGNVELHTWNHVICNWDEKQLLQEIAGLPSLEVHTGHREAAVAHILTQSDQIYALCLSANSVSGQTAALRDIVRVYQKNAILHRTSLNVPEEIWPVYEDAIAVILFPEYQPAHIIAAALEQTFLPPGVSRHIVQGRALRVNYPIVRLRDPFTDLETKNTELRHWVQERYARRQVRFYAESTFQFDE